MAANMVRSPRSRWVVPVACLLSAAAWLAPPMVRAAEPSSETRAAVDRGLAFLAKEALTWKETKTCTSCHHGPMSIWSLNEAKQLGYAIDEKAVTDLTVWALAKSEPARAPSGQPTQEPVSINEALLLLALGIEGGPADDEATREGLKKILSALLEQQRPDGSWALQSLAEPIGSTPDVITSLMLLSLTAPHAPDMGQPAKDARDKGLAWLSSQTAEASLQGLAIKLVLWKRLDRPVAECQALSQQILALQRPDGGWGQTNDLPSDAYATGVSLYALSEASMPADDPAIANARSFLLKNQQEPGSWPMSSRPKERDNKPSTNLAPIVYAGTFWAVRGLMRSEPAIVGRVSSAQ